MPTDTPAPYEIDTKTALARLGGRRDIYLRMLAQFAPTYRDAEKRIRRLLGRQDMDGAYRLVHSIKNASAGIGLSSLSGVSQQLETSIFHRRETMGLYLGLFGESLDTALRMIPDVLKQDPSSGAAPPASAKPVRPASKVLKTIAGHAQRGEYSRLSRALDLLEGGRPEFREFCAAIRSHAARYDDDAIVAFIEQED